MSGLMVRDIPENRELDQSAMAELQGGGSLGLFGHLAGLHAARPGTSLVPSVMNNFFIDYKQTLVQVNPVNVVLEGNSNVIENLTVTSVNTGNITVAQDAGGLL